MTSIATRQVCVGLQAEAGTAVNVDTLLRATCNLKPNVTKIHPEENIGSYAPARHYIGQQMPEGTLTMDATYEQILIPLSMALGDQAGVGGVAPYTYTFPIPDDVNDEPTFALWTVEYTDGGTYVVRAEDVFASALTISGIAGEGWKVEAELTGGTVDLPDALSASPALDDTVTPIKMAETLLYVDATYAGIGVTNAEELISFTWKIEDYLHTKQFAGGLSPNGRGTAPWKMSLELIMEVSAAEAQAFADAVLATTQFAVQVAGVVDANDSCKINGMYMVESVDSLDDRDGNNTIKVSLMGEKDASDNTGAVIVVTDVAAY